MFVLKKSVHVTFFVSVSQGRKIQPCSLLWSPARLPSPWWQPDDVCGRPGGQLLTARRRQAVSPETRWGADFLPWVRSCHASGLCTGKRFSRQAHQSLAVVAYILTADRFLSLPDFFFTLWTGGKPAGTQLSLSHPLTLYFTWRIVHWWKILWRNSGF